MAQSKRGLRGGTLEEIINLTNAKYIERKIAIVQKIPTPITPVQIDAQNKTITLAYFEKRSTIDYIGLAQGVSFCFDAKETKLKNLPINNMHQHQIDFMQQFEEQGGISFILAYFSAYNQYFIMPFKDLKPYWDRAIKGGKKSISYEDFNKKYEIKLKGGHLNYLEGLNTLLGEDE